MAKVLSLRNQIRSSITICEKKTEAPGKPSNILLPTDPIIEEDLRRRPGKSMASLKAMSTHRSAGKGFMDVFPKFDSQSSLSQYFFGNTTKKRLDTTVLSSMYDKESEAGPTNVSFQCLGPESLTTPAKQSRVPACFLKKFTMKEQALKNSYSTRSTKLLPKTVTLRSCTKVAKINHGPQSLKQIPSPTKGYLDLTYHSQKMVTDYY